MERIRTLAELPFRIDFLFVGKIIIILKILGGHKSDNSKIQAPLRILAAFAHRVQTTLKAMTVPLLNLLLQFISSKFFEAKSKSFTVGIVN